MQIFQNPIWSDLPKKVIKDLLLTLRPFAQLPKCIMGYCDALWESMAAGGSNKMNKKKSF